LAIGALLNRPSSRTGSPIVVGAIGVDAVGSEPAEFVDVARCCRCAHQHAEFRTRKLVLHSGKFGPDEIGNSVVLQSHGIVERRVAESVEGVGVGASFKQLIYKLMMTV
jgi:hypothetical protein